MMVAEAGEEAWEILAEELDRMRLFIFQVKLAS